MNPWVFFVERIPSARNWIFLDFDRVLHRIFIFVYGVLFGRWLDRIFIIVFVFS
jgi:hypothetical protein